MKGKTCCWRRKNLQEKGRIPSVEGNTCRERKGILRRKDLQGSKGFLQEKEKPAGKQKKRPAGKEIIPSGEVKTCSEREGIMQEKDIHAREERIISGEGTICREREGILQEKERHERKGKASCRRRKDLQESK